MWNKLFIILFLTFSYGCLENEEEIGHCSFASKNYLYTNFDCFDYSVDYRLCHRPDQINCVDFAPESIMGHCESENICQTFAGS